MAWLLSREFAARIWPKRWAGYSNTRTYFKRAGFSMSKDITDAVREICLGLHDATEVISRDSPNFRVANKTFGIYQINHHGDGRVALWLHSSDGAQAFYVAEDPNHYFVPPYVGPSGWLGVNLDTGLDWQTISKQIHAAFTRVAPAKVAVQQTEPVTIKPPSEGIDPAIFDPYQRPEIAAKLAQISQYCLALTETRLEKQFGSPCFRAGKKTFCTLHFYRGLLEVSVWAGGEEQALRIADPRFRIPKYIGHRGWLNLDIGKRMDMEEVGELILTSYQHFALKRMLRALQDIQGNLL